MIRQMASKTGAEIWFSDECGVRLPYWHDLGAIGQDADCGKHGSAVSL